MTITSNIAGVIRQVERLRANVPLAADRALARPEWEAEAKAAAEKTLLSPVISTSAQHKYIPGFVETVVSAFASPERFFTMKMPVMDQLDQEAQSAIDRARAALAAGGNPQWQDLKAAVLAWVETPVTEGGKRHDNRDARKTDDEIAQFISFLITAPQGKLIGDRASAHQALERRIVEWIFKANLTMTRETVDAWLRAVLAAWRVMVVRSFPGKMRAELRAMKGEL